MTRRPFARLAGGRRHTEVDGARARWVRARLKDNSETAARARARQHRGAICCWATRRARTKKAQREASVAAAHAVN